MFNVNLDTMFTSQSMATNFTSVPQDINGCTVWALEMSWTGNNAVSTVHLEGSVSGVVWCNIENSTKSVPLSTTLDHELWDYGRPTGLRFIRLVFTAGSNSAGTMTAVINKKLNRAGDFPGR